MDLFFWAGFRVLSILEGAGNALRGGFSSSAGWKGGCGSDQGGPQKTQSPVLFNKDIFGGVGFAEGYLGSLEKVDYQAVALILLRVVGSMVYSFGLKVCEARMLGIGACSPTVIGHIVGT